MESWKKSKTTNKSNTGLIGRLVLVVILSLSATAAEKNPKQPIEKRPKVQQGDIPQPVITIRQTKQSTVKEYRVNGVLRAIKFTPKNGMPAYYLVDREGSGEFVRMGPDVGKQLAIPQWILFSW